MSKLEPNPGFVPLSGLPLQVGRGTQADLCLTEPTVSRQHAVLEVRDGRLLVRDLESRFGTFVNGLRIRERQLRPGDRVRFGEVVTYAVEESGLRLVPAESAGLSVRGLEVKVANRVLVSFGGWRWSLASGQVAGILGPSGAGKTMLLRTLGGIRPPSSGIIACGDLPDVWKDIDSYRRRLAFIPQDDVVNPLLTVRENIALTCELRLADKLPAPERQRRVEAALELFGLKEHAEKLARYLSGGQRKRTSVAMEWIRRPELFLLDEPTAGLDPANEARLMENLVVVARQGATVICTTHLMENIYLLDSVLVLGVFERQGRVAYAGPPDALLPTLGCRNFADLYERLERGEFEPLGGAGRESSNEDGQGSPAGASPEEIEELGTNTGTRRLALRKLAIPPTREVDPLSVRVVAQRTALGIWRDRWMRWMTIGQPAILAVVVALTQFSPGKIFGLLFFTTVVACWLGMNNSIRDLVRDRRAYIRDRLGGLAPGSYLLAKWLVYGLIGLAQLVFFLVLLRLLLPSVLPENLRDEVTQRSLVAWLGGLWLAYLGGLGLAFVISTVVGSEEAAVAWLPILILPQILFSSTATGVSILQYTDARPFRPLIVTLRYPFTAAQEASEKRERLKRIEVLVDSISLALVCRPAVLVVERPKVSGFGPHIWLGDLCHLLFLIVIHGLMLWVVFLNQERRWPALVGY
ncbi:MAG: ATP-binding cassette domain-containing protein [Thermogutta sp.]|jgi:ABC-type multidrug transport system ATPase subunit